MDLEVVLNILIQIQQSGKSIPHRDEILEFLNPVDLNKLKRIQKQLARIRGLTFNPATPKRKHKTKKAFTGWKGYLQGLVFEKLIVAIFEKSQIFDLQSRVITAACEIDFFIHVIGPYHTLFPIVSPHTRLHGEAKCHAVNAKSEWVNTQVGKMTGNGTRLGMLFTFQQPGAAPSQFRTAIKDHFRANPPTEVIPWGPSLVDDLIAGKPFLRLVIVQHNLAYTGTTALKL